jgi:DNA-binding NarL/FixJ family response regulator
LQHVRLSLKLSATLLTTAMKTVYIVEDQTLLRDLIYRLLEQTQDVEILGASGNGQDGLEAIERLQPDVVVLDIMLPHLNGVEVVRRLNHSARKPKILVFSGFPSKDMVRKVLEAGIDGFVEKDANLTELETAFDKILNGQTYFGLRIVELMREIMVNPHRVDALDGLTPRERQVLQLIAESHTSKEIAAKLEISVKTADTHRANLMKKLNVHDVAGLTRQAVAFGLVEAHRTP